MADLDEQELMLLVDKAFRTNDIEETGIIEHGMQLTTAIAMCKVKTDEKELKDVLTKLEKTESDPVDMELFGEIVKELLARQDLKAAFRCFDKDKSGSIAPAVLRKIIEGMVEDAFPEDELDQMIKDADTDGDGTIDIEEFVSFMMNV